MSFDMPAMQCISPLKRSSTSGRQCHFCCKWKKKKKLILWGRIIKRFIELERNINSNNREAANCIRFSLFLFREWAVDIVFIAVHIIGWWRMALLSKIISFFGHTRRFDDDLWYCDRHIVFQFTKTYIIRCTTDSFNEPLLTNQNEEIEWNIYICDVNKWTSLSVGSATWNYEFLQFIDCSDLANKR